MAVVSVAESSRPARQWEGKMLQQTPGDLVSIRKLGPDPGWVQVNARNVRRSVPLISNPKIVVVILDDGHVIPVTTESAEEAGLIH